MEWNQNEVQIIFTNLNELSLWLTYLIDFVEIYINQSVMEDWTDNKLTILVMSQWAPIFWLFAATGLVILLQLDSNHRFFSQCDLDIWWMTSKSYRAPLLHYIKLCALSQIPQSIQTGVIVQKYSNWLKICDFFVPCDLEIWWMTLNKANLRVLIAATGLVILLILDSNRFFSPCDLEIWWMTPKNNRAPLLCYFKLCAAFRSHWWIQTGVTVQKQIIWV